MEAESKREKRNKETGAKRVRGREEGGGGLLPFMVRLLMSLF